MNVLLIDLIVTSGDHLPLNVRLPNEQLCHGALVAVFGDPTDSDLLAHHKTSQMVSSCFGWHRLCSLPAEFRTVNASQSNLFPIGRGAGVAVVTGGDHSRCKSCKEYQ